MTFNQTHVKKIVVFNGDLIQIRNSFFILYPLSSYLYRSWSVFHPRRPRSHWPHCHNPSQGRKTMPYLQGDLVLAEIGKRRIRTMRSMRPRSRRMKNNSRYIKIWRWMTLSCPTMKSWKKSTLYASLKKSSINLPKICHLNTKIMNIQRFEFLNDSTCCPSLLGCRLVATTWDETGLRSLWSRIQTNTRELRAQTLEVEKKSWFFSRINFEK